MKTFFSIILVGSLLISKVSAQNSSVKSPSIGVIIPPSHGVTSGNYLLSLSEPDFQNQKYVFYTDSNATVAHINIKGTDTRLPGGPNAEHIMIYTYKEYTVTLSANGNKGANAAGHSAFTLTIYPSNGQPPIVEQVTGTKINN